MTTTDALAMPQPKTDPKRSAPAPTRREKETPEESLPDTDRWSDMPCTD